MEPNKTVEDFIRISLEIFDGNFMVDEDVERRKVFRKHPDVLKFLERAYVTDGDRETVDLCLETIWKYLREMGEI